MSKPLESGHKFIEVPGAGSPVCQKCGQRREVAPKYCRPVASAMQTHKNLVGEYDPFEAA